MIGFATFALLMVFRPLPPNVGQALSYVVQSATVLAACVVMARKARSGQAALRRARGLLSASLFFATTGGVAALVLRLVGDGEPPVPSVADALHFAFLPLCVLGVLSYPTSRDWPGSRAQMVLDGVVAATALWFLTYSLVLAPAGVGAATPPLTAVTVLAYPAADVFVIAMAAGAMHRVAPAARRELTLSALGVSLYAVSDIAYTALYARGRYTADSWVAAVAELGLLLIVVAAATRSDAPSARAAWLGSLPQVSAASAVLFALGLAISRGRLAGTELVMLLALTVALLARQVVGTRDRHRVLRRLRSREALFRSLVVGSSDLITTHRSDGSLTYASPAVSRLTGLAPDELPATSLLDLVHPDDAPAVESLLQGLLRSPGRTQELLLRFRAGDGGWRWCQTLAQNRLDDPDVGAIVCNTRDIHERHLLEERLRHDAHHDALTGLGNLTYAREVLAAACSPDDGRPTVVALIDLDGFKQVNDTFGHAEGDALLITVARRLRECVRSTDEVARLGGDEFLVILADDGSAEAVAQRVLESLGETLVVGGRHLRIGASIGLASGSGGDTPDDLLRNADLAMYAAKAAGRNQVAAFRPSMLETAEQTMAVTTQLRRAVSEELLEVHYQPVRDLVTGDLAFVEALLRWREEDGRTLPPDVFIPVAEDAGLMPQIDAWVLGRACQDLARWRRDGVDVPKVSVNVSRRSLTVDLPPLVAATLRQHGVPAHELCLEITETAVARDPVTSRDVLARIRDLGVQVALDDFGTGQSSLSELATLPIDLVKIDHSSLRRVEQDRSLALLTSVASLCATLGLSVVAEGIDDAALVTQLRRSGCAYGQGYALGRPQPAATLGRDRSDPVGTAGDRRGEADAGPAAADQLAAEPAT